jgi:hypothetical protein
LQNSKVDEAITSGEIEFTVGFGNIFSLFGLLGNGDTARASCAWYSRMKSIGAVRKMLEEIVEDTGIMILPSCAHCKSRLRKEHTIRVHTFAAESVRHLIYNRLKMLKTNTLHKNADKAFNQ